jgi:hypothetical protein
MFGSITAASTLKRPFCSLMLVLNRAGAQVVDLKNAKKTLADKYKANTKKELKNYKCKSSEELVNPTLEGGLRGL